MNTIFRNIVFRIKNHKNACKVYRFYTEDVKAPQLQEVYRGTDKKLRITSIPKTIDEVNMNIVDVIKKDKLLPPLIKEKDDFVPFKEIPGPLLLTTISNFMEVIPTFGHQVTTSTIKYMLGSHISWGNNTRLFKYLMDEYGPVVRLQSPFGGDVVILTRSEDAISVFTNEGRYPMRSSLDSIEKYRMEYRNYKNIGPFLMHGEDWASLRIEIEKPLSETFLYQFKKIESVCDNFVQRIREIRNRQEEVPGTFINDIYKWSLECLCTVLFGHKFGFMDERASVPNSEPAMLLKAFHDATRAIKKCEAGFQMWRFFETPSWKLLVKSCDTIDGILTNNIKAAKEVLSSKKEDELCLVDSKDIPILEALLMDNKLSLEEILTVFLDMMLIGANSAAHSLSFLLYHLARNPRVQRKLADEIRTSPETIEAGILPQFTFLNACIKESLRLKPPIPILSRILTSDIVVHNYKVPKGTVVLMATYLSSLREENFDDAEKFLPERWLNSHLSGENNFATMPFGFGPRACLAKNMADMQLSLIIFKILRAFKVEYHYGNIHSTNTMLASPDRDLKFRFLNRFHFKL